MAIGVASACLVGPVAGPAGARPSDSGQGASDLLVVDCLLPPTIQRLGNSVTYLRARKAVKTSAAECRKRGGEYSEAGKETYAALTKIWLPLANAGDAEAQTNLGEIFEQGKGGPPQPDMAAQWYRRAAEAGYARAQVNLGSLYERGLGVPKNQSTAMQWYRRASGLENESLAFQAGSQNTEVQRLQRERDDLARQLEQERSKRKALEQGAASDVASAPDDAALNIQRKPQKVARSQRKTSSQTRYHALIIGNNDFEHIPSLTTAVNDARTIEAILRKQYGYKTTLLIDGSRYQLLSALNTLREELTERDNLLIFYAGHGALDEVNDRGYWLPVDAEAHSNANWIPSWQITDLMNAMNAGQIMLIADSCYAGTLTRASIPTAQSGMNEADRARWIEVMTRRRTRVVLTSGGVKPVLDTGGGQHSVFAAALIRALESNHQALEGQKLANTITGQVKAAALRQKFDQVPMYAPIRYAGHEAGDYFFIPR
ncbi:MAG: caspase family protein [Novosphingobium sp.]|nr:caspase family protein [Novosphingobium sp.]